VSPTRSGSPAWSRPTPTCRGCTTPRSSWEAKVLRVRDLALGYGGEPVVEGASLDVAEGQFVSLVGPSGSGKSSILRAIIGLQPRLSGTIGTRLDPSQVGILFQDDALLPWRTARDNVALGLSFRGMGWREALDVADQWLARLGLAEFVDRYPRRLSGGQRKRVALAQVLAQKPRLLLMDEPFASLDAIVRMQIVQDLVGLVERERISVLLVTHDLEEAIALSDVVYLLAQGPRAHITEHYPVPIPRPRDPVRARTHPAFAPLLEKLWRDLSREVTGERPKAEAA
jgi:NitT/TauT family transport system ATP-binding protein